MITDARIAAFTRGFSLENDYRWKASWQEFDETVSDIPIRRELERIGIKDIIRLDEPGVLVVSYRGAFSLLVTACPTCFEAARPGNVSASMCILDITEGDARAIASHILTRWEDRSKEIGALIIRHKIEPGQPEWSFESEKIREYFRDLIQSIPMTREPTQSNRTRLTYPANRDSGFLDLAKQAADQIFSSCEGVKIAVGFPFDSSKERAMLSGGDFLAFPGLPPAQVPWPIQPSDPNDTTVTDSAIPVGIVVVAFVVVAVLLFILSPKKKAPESLHGLKSDNQASKAVNAPPAADDAASHDQRDLEN